MGPTANDDDADEDIVSVSFPESCPTVNTSETSNVSSMESEPFAKH